MKRGRYLVLITLLAVSILAAAQENIPASRSIFKLSPQHFYNKALKIGFERVNAEYSTSVAVFLTGFANRYRNSLQFHDQYDAIAGELQWRTYVRPIRLYTTRKHVPYHDGIYLAAYAQAGYYYEHFIDNITNGYMYAERIKNGGFGLTAGYQRTIWQVVFLEAFVGGGIQFAKVHGSDGSYQRYYLAPPLLRPEYKGIYPKVGIQIGVGL